MASLHLMESAGKAAENNAAFFYVSALDKLPEGAKKEAYDVKDANHLSDKEADIAHRCEASIQLLHQGAQSPHCDWRIRYDEGINDDVAPAAAMMALANAARLRARWLFEQNDEPGAVSVLTDLIRLSRHVDQEQVPLLHIAGVFVERCASSVVEDRWQDLSKEGLRQIAASLEAAGSVPPIADAFRKEGEMQRYHLPARPNLPRI
jgi:hypothetical protein